MLDKLLALQKIAIWSPTMPTPFYSHDESQELGRKAQHKETIRPQMK